MEIPDNLVTQELSKYGEIYAGFRVKKDCLEKSSITEQECTNIKNLTIKYRDSLDCSVE